MEGNQESNKKHVCKVCGMSFFSGKALGGHMRGHNYIANLKDCGKTTQVESAAVYGLRENPKKSWRFSDSKKKKRIPRKEASCDVCGKDGFRSVNALSTHMRSSHLESNVKENACNCKECGKGFSTKRACFGHMRCHSERCRVSKEISGPVKKKRSKRVTVKVIAPPPSLHSSYYGSEFEVDSEIENAAVSLMMLNMEFNSGFKVNRYPPRSDQITENNIKSSDRMAASKKKRRKKSDSYSRVQISRELELEVPVHENYELETSTTVDARVLEIGTKFSDSRSSDFDVPVDEFLYGGDIGMPPTGSDTACVIELGANIWDSSTELEIPVNEILIGCEIEKPTSEYDIADDPKLGTIFCEDAPVADNTDEHNVGKYSCKTCKRCFNSHQALGGHRAAGHKIKNPSTANLSFINIERVDEISSEIGDNVSCRKHECSVCSRLFRSGQALGGHKRAHYAEANVHVHGVMFDLNWPPTLAFENDDLLSTT